MKMILTGLNAKFVHSNLAIYELEAYIKKYLAKEKQQQMELLLREYTINHNLDQILSSIYKEKADVVAFSCYIWNIAETLQIARELKKVAPNTKIVLGGPEVSYDSEQQLERNQFVDVVIVGEGEATLLEFIERCLECDTPTQTADVVRQGGVVDSNDGLQAIDFVKLNLEGVLGLSYRDVKGAVRSNGLRSLLNMNDLPFVYDDLSRFDHKIIYYETSRGCPFSCSYCLSSIGHSVRFRSMELVEKELQFFIDNKVPQVKFVDRTFNCQKSHSRAIWQYITEHDNGITNFHFEVGADLIQEEDIELFSKMRPGLIQLEIGLQSTNAKTISEIQRVMDISKLKKTLLKVRALGNIHQHLDLIAGLPFEDYETFQTSFDQAYDMRPNQLQLGFLKVLKGSYMKEQVDVYEIAFQDTQPYEVLSTKWISYDEILELKKVEEMVEVYYNSDQFEHVLPFVVSHFERPFAFYHALGEYYEQNDLYGIGFKRELRYTVLREFCMQCGLISKEEFKLLDSLLLFDYYLRENAKNRPSWSKIEPIDKVSYQEFFRAGGNDQVRIDSEGYDSKVAARKMHIEPLDVRALPWILDDMDYESFVVDGNTDIIYALYDYDHVNLLSKDATVVMMTRLA